MGIGLVTVNPPHRLSRCDAKTNWLEPHVGAHLSTRHDDVHGLRGECQRAREDQGGGNAAARSKDLTTGRSHSATFDSASAETCQRMIWACGTSTPGWPGLYTTST